MFQYRCLFGRNDNIKCLYYKIFIPVRSSMEISTRRRSMSSSISYFISNIGNDRIGHLASIRASAFFKHRRKKTDLWHLPRNCVKLQPATCNLLRQGISKALKRTAYTNLSEYFYINCREFSYCILSRARKEHNRSNLVK